MKTIISKRGDSLKVKGEFYVTYSAVRNGKKYTTIHLNPCGIKDISAMISADELNSQWQLAYKGLCPFNGDSNFEIVKIQQRFNN